MKSRVEALKKQRVRVFCVCIVYFLVLLAVGALIFLKDAAYGPQLAAGCVALYLLLVRPVLRGYTQQLRRGVLETTLGATLREMTYAPKQGYTAVQLEQTGLTPVPLSSHLSREQVTGRSGGLQVTVADVTFPFRSGGLNEMFNGCALRVEASGCSFPQLRVEAGEVVSGEAEAPVAALLEELGSFIPGSLYVNTVGSTLYVILRGRFLGYKLNPLMDVSERTLFADPLPELKLVLELARKLQRSGNTYGN